MRRQIVFVLLALYVLVPFMVQAAPPGIVFMENKGQWPSNVFFKNSLGHGSAFFEKNRILFSFIDAASLGHPSHSHNPYEAQNQHEISIHDGTEKVTSHSYYLNFLNSIEPECIEGKEPGTAKVNFIRGNDPDDWISQANTYASILYGGIYEDVDLVFYQYQDYLKYDITVYPGGNADEIALQYEATHNVSLKEGNLIVETEVGYMTELKPYAYQVIEGQVHEVKCVYKLKDGIVGFGFPRGYDNCYDLVIDPLLIFSTYSGSTYDNWGNTASYDQSGNLYSGGMVTTLSGGNSYPVTTGVHQESFGGGVWDVGLLKYDSSGRNLLYATYLGGNGTETPQSIVVADDGSLLILGATSSVDFPVTNASMFKGGTDIIPLGGVRYDTGADMFVSKLSPDGSTLIASTYLGGSENDAINFIAGDLNAVNGSSNIRVESPLARNYGDQLRGDIFVDALDNVYIASSSLSEDFLMGSNILNTFHGGNLDAIVVKLSPDLDVSWARFLGGTGDEAAYSIKLNSLDEIVVAGGTTSFDFSDLNSGWQGTLSGNVDGWIYKIAPDGSLVNEGTFLGTPAYDQAYFIDLDTADNIFVYGQTQGAYPVSAGVFNEPNGGQFLQKFNSDLTQSLFSTRFGSGGNTPDISPTAFLVNECDNIYLAGWGGATNAPTINVGFNQRATRNFVGGNTFGLRTSVDAFDAITFGNDFYLMVLSGNAERFLYGTFFGGTTSNTHVDGGTSRFDKSGVVYHAVCAGCGGDRNDFPATPNAWSGSNLSSNCNNASFKFDLASLKADFNTNSLDFDDPGVSVICLGEPLVLQNRSIGGRIYDWDFGDGTDITRPDTTFIVHNYSAEGTYIIRLRAFDPNTCISEDFAFKTVEVLATDFVLMDDAEICFGEEIRLEARGATSYHWVSADGTFTSSDQNPVVKPGMDTRYYVTFREAPCEVVDSLDVKVLALLEADFNTNSLDFDAPGVSSVCLGEPLVFENFSRGGIQYDWNFGDGTDTTRMDSDFITHQYASGGVYLVRLRAFDPTTCTSENFAFKTVEVVDPEFSLLDDVEICFGDEIRLEARGATSYAWRSSDGTFTSVERNPVVRPEEDTRYYITFRTALCDEMDSVDVRVVPEVAVGFTVSRNFDCWTEPSIELTNTMTDPDAQFIWDLGDGNTSTEETLVYNYEEAGEFVVRLKAVREFCTYEARETVDISRIAVPNVLTPSVPGDNDTFVILAPSKVSLKIFNRSGRAIYENDDYRNEWAGEGQAAGVYYYEANMENEATCKGWVHLIK